MKLVLHDEDIKDAIVLWVFYASKIEINKKDVNLLIDFNKETIEADVTISKNSK